MKKIALILSITLAILGCQDAKKEKVTVEGEYIYFPDAAVLKGDTFIYGVKNDKIAEELGTTVKPLKRDDFDMVPVVVEGYISQKEENSEGWEQILTITKVLEVKAPTGKAPIKIDGNSSTIPLDTLKQQVK